MFMWEKIVEEDTLCTRSTQRAAICIDSFNPKTRFNMSCDNFFFHSRVQYTRIDESCTATVML